MDMYVTEPQGIDEILARYEGRNAISPQSIPATITRPGGSRTRARVTYSPTEDEQRNFNPDGLSGDVVLVYDVEHDRQGSHTQVTICVVFCLCENYCINSFCELHSSDQKIVNGLQIML